MRARARMRCSPTPLSLTMQPPSDINFQDSLIYTAPSSDLYIDDDELGKLLGEVHRDCADYRRAEGVNVSQSVSVSHVRSNGGTCGKER